MIGDRTRDTVNGLRRDANEAVKHMRTAATSLQEAGAAISRTSALVAAVSIVAIVVAVYALYTVHNSRE